MKKEREKEKREKGNGRLKNSGARLQVRLWDDKVMMDVKERRRRYVKTKS